MDDIPAITLLFMTLDTLSKKLLLWLMLYQISLTFHRMLFMQLLRLWIQSWWRLRAVLFAKSLRIYKLQQIHPVLATAYFSSNDPPHSYVKFQLLTSTIYWLISATFIKWRNRLQSFISSINCKASFTNNKLKLDISSVWSTLRHWIDVSYLEYSSQNIQCLFTPDNYTFYSYDANKQ